MKEEDLYTKQMYIYKYKDYNKLTFEEKLKAYPNTVIDLDVMKDYGCVYLFLYNKYTCKYYCFVSDAYNGVIGGNNTFNPSGLYTRHENKGFITLEYSDYLKSREEKLMPF